MMQTIVMLAFASLLGVLLSSVTGTMFKDLSQQRSFEEAEKIIFIGKGLLMDPYYCGVLLNGTEFPEKPELPVLLRKDIHFKEVNDEGVMAGRSILHPGQKSFKYIQIENIQFQAKTKISQNRYIGDLSFGLTGGRIYINRTIPVIFAINSELKIESCSYFSTDPVGAAIGEWSETCDDYRAKGWDTKDACLRDGRWHLVLETDPSGNATRGEKQDLMGYVHRGGDVRVVSPEGVRGYKTSYDMCVAMEQRDGESVCLVGAHSTVSGEKQASELKAITYSTSGKVILSHPNNHVMEPIKWYVRF